MLEDNKCQELWFLLQQARSASTFTVHDMIRYRREAERNVGTDQNLYRFDWVSGSASVLVSGLLGAACESHATGGEGFGNSGDG